MHVIVRPPSAAFVAALSQHPERDRIDPDRAVRQHAAFVSALESGAVEVVHLPAEPRLPDAPFVSDTVLALPDRANPGAKAALLVVTRPAEASRRPEVESVIECARTLLPPGTPEVAIIAPATLEGGDAIVLGDRLLIGVSARTNPAGARTLAEAARRLGYRPYLCPVTDRLHLATAVTAVRDDLLIGTEAGFRSLDAAGPEAAPAAFVDRLTLPDDELPAANVLALGGRCILPAGFPRAVELLENAGLNPLPVELDEFTRADGGPTCLVAIIP